MWSWIISPPRRPKRKAFGIFRPFLTFAHLLVLSHGKICWSREAYSTLCRLCACSESSAFHQATEKQMLEMKQVLSINWFQLFNTFQLLLLNTCHITHGFATSCGCLFFLSLSSLWDLTSGFIFFLCSLACFYASLFCPPLFHPVQKRKSSSSVYLMVRSVPCLSAFSDSPSTLSHSLALFFFFLVEMLESLFWSLFCLIVGFCES